MRVTWWFMGTFFENLSYGVSTCHHPIFPPHVFVRLFPPNLFILKCEYNESSRTWTFEFLMTMMMIDDDEWHSSLCLCFPSWFHDDFSFFSVVVDVAVHNCNCAVPLCLSHSVQLLSELNPSLFAFSIYLLYLPICESFSSCNICACSLLCDRFILAIQQWTHVVKPYTPPSFHSSFIVYSLYSFV